MLFFWNFLLRVEWERNGIAIFIFSISRPFPTNFGLEWTHNGIFWFFFFCFFGNFYYLSGKNGTKRQFLFFLFLGLFQLILALNEAITLSFNLLNFLAILFWIFSYASGRSGSKRNDNFLFSLFEPFPTCFGLKWRHSGIF